MAIKQALARWGALVSVAALLVGCGGGGTKKASSGASSASHSSSASTVGSGGSSSSAIASAASSSTGGGDSGGVISAASDGSPSASTAAGPRVQPDVGTYTYAVSGTASLGGTAQSIPPTSTITISQLNSTDQKATGGSMDTVLRWAPESASLVSLHISQANKDFVPAQPVLYVPFPGQAGRGWQWTLTSRDGKTTVDQTSTITGSDSVAVGGQDVPVFVVHSVLKLSGDIVGTVDLTSWVSDAYRLAVKQHAVTDATYNVAIRIQSDTTSQLESLTPT